MLNLYADTVYVKFSGSGTARQSLPGQAVLMPSVDITEEQIYRSAFRQRLLDDEKCMKYNADLCRTLPNRYQSDKPGEVVEL